jgi:hypothetical protein
VNLLPIPSSDGLRILRNITGSKQVVRPVAVAVQHCPPLSEASLVLDQK